MNEMIFAIDVWNHGDTPELVEIKRGETTLMQFGVSRAMGTKQPLRRWLGLFHEMVRSPGKVSVYLQPGSEFVLLKSRAEIHAEHAPSVEVTFYYHSYETLSIMPSAHTRETQG